jgi:hypothetical protein
LNRKLILAQNTIPCGSTSHFYAHFTLHDSYTCEYFIFGTPATTQALLLRNFVGGLKIVDSIARPIKIFCDNRAAIFFSKNNKSRSRSTHINIKYFQVRENIKINEVFIEHISTELMIADPMTKDLPIKLFKSHVEHMGLIDSFCT